MNGLTALIQPWVGEVVSLLVSVGQVAVAAATVYYIAVKIKSLKKRNETENSRETPEEGEGSK